MINYKRTKKKLIISYKNLSDDLKLVFKDTYPDGYKDYIQKITKPDGEPLFVVPMETEDTSYLIRFDLKIDTLQAKDLEKEMFDTDDKVDDTDFSPMTEALEKDDDLGNNHTERVLNHGSYEGILDEMTSDNGKKKKDLSEHDEIMNELKEEFNDDDDDEYSDSYNDDMDDDDEFEPSEEDLAEVEQELLDSDLTKKNDKRGRKKSTTKAPAKTSATKKPAAKTTAKATSKATTKTTTKKSTSVKKK